MVQMKTQKIIIEYKGKEIPALLIEKKDKFVIEINPKVFFGFFWKISF